MLISFGQATEVTAKIHKVFSYGRRNSFGLAFDPMSGSLWEAENGHDSSDEINRIAAASNGGWIQIMGLADQVPDFERIETSFTPPRGNVPSPAIFCSARLTQSPSYWQFSKYSHLEFGWKWIVAPAAIGFGDVGLGPKRIGNLFVGSADPSLEGGYLFKFKFDSTRQHLAFDDSRLNLSWKAELY